MLKADTGGRDPIETGQLKRRGVVTLIDQAAVSGTNFLTSIVIARAVAKDEFGLYVLAFTILVVLTNFQVALISTPYTYLSPRLERQSRKSYSGSTLLFFSGLSVVSTLFLTLFAAISSEDPALERFSRILWILAVVVSLVLLREYCRRFLFANLMVNRALIFDMFAGLIQVIGLILLFNKGKLDVDSGLYWIGICSVLPSIVLLLNIKRYFKISTKRIVLDFRRSWSIARWSSAEVIARSTGAQSYPWILALFHGPVAVGVFGACMGPILLANPVFIGTANFLAPNVAHELANRGLSGLRNIIQKTTIFLISFMSIFSLLVWFFGDELVVLFYGDQYGGNGLVVSALALSLIPTGCTIPIQCGLVALGRPDVGFKSYVLALVVTLTLGISLIQHFGPLGVAMGMFVGNFLASGCQYFYYRKILGHQMRS